MAGLIEIHEEFAKAQTSIQVTTPDRIHPLFLLTLPDGTLDVKGTRWAMEEDGQSWKLNEDGNRYGEDPVVTEGTTFAPILINLRSIHSPDAEQYRRDHDVFGFNIFDPKLSEEVKIVVAGSMIIGWENLTLDTDEGLLEYNEENKGTLLDGYPSITKSVLLECMNTKKLSCLS